ncbi:MAG TPA: DNA-formamidopyrimidine glycosylase [Pseudogracilibacillus sp.]|nr:DNA-formamidopyrimidine glycosylase [Pseudogracilibacillus sp.]
MPELPEVETIRRTLKELVLNKKITDIEVFWGKIIKHPDDIEHFKQIIIGQTIRDVKRKGKFLIFELDTEMLVSHLRMEGKYFINQNGMERDKHTHVIFNFSDGSSLNYNDVRKFGTMHVFSKENYLKVKPLNQLGPDPFEDDFSIDYLKEKLSKTTRYIKAALLDQTIIAGLGNIYVDEVLFKAKIHPEKRANTLTEEQIELISKYSYEVLKAAVKQGGTTIRSYVNGEGEMGLFQQELYVYGQENEVCKVCGDTIEKFKSSGRGTHVCLTCQKK